MTSAVGGWTYDALETRALFGVGIASTVGSEFDRLAATKVMVIASAGAATRHASTIKALGGRHVAHFDGVEPHCPIETVEAGLSAYRSAGADALLTIGGGSAIGVAKNLRLRTGAASIVCPTTYSGAEMTPIYGALTAGEKKTGRDPAAKPQTVIYDPLLTLSLPHNETVSTGMNGLAHCIEAFYPQAPNPLTSTIAAAGVEAFFGGLPASVARPEAIAGRTLALRGGFFGGLLVQLVGIGLHHRICHVLGGRFNIAHGVSNSVMLPYVAAFNREAILRAAPALFEPFGSRPGRAIKELGKRIDAPASLAGVGLQREDLYLIAQETLSKPLFNPSPLNVGEVQAILEAAWAGDDPDG